MINSRCIPVEVKEIFPIGIERVRTIWWCLSYFFGSVTLETEHYPIVKLIIDGTPFSTSFEVNALSEIDDDEFKERLWSCINTMNRLLKRESKTGR